MALIKGLPWLDRELRMRNAIVRAWFFICIAMICREIQIAWNRGKPHNCLSNVFARKCEGLCNTRRSNMICHKESFPERTSWALINSINSFLFMACKDCLMLLSLNYPSVRAPFLKSDNGALFVRLSANRISLSSYLSNNS